MHELCVVLQYCNPIFGIVKAERSEIQSHPRSYSNLKASLGHMRKERKKGKDGLSNITYPLSEGQGAIMCFKYAN